MDKCPDEFSAVFEQIWDILLCGFISIIMGILETSLYDMKSYLLSLSFFR